MDKVTVPLIDAEAKSGAALRILKNSRALAAAVRVGDSYRVIPTETIIQVDSGGDRMSVMARLMGFKLPSGDIDLAGECCRFGAIP